MKLNNRSMDSQSNTELRALYIEDGDEAISAWQHTPLAGEIKDTVVLICPPIGYEYTHSYRSLRRLAERLCAAGFVVIRFDYYATGNSSGCILDENCLQRWIGNINIIADHINASYPGFKQCWLGLRLGATLAVKANENRQADALVLWEPIISGRAYIRELEALSLLSSSAGDVSLDYLESAGFLIPTETANQIKKINLRKQHPLTPGTRVLHLARDDRPLDDAFIQGLQEQGMDAAIHAIEGYDGMMAEPHYTKVPLVAIDYLGDWLSQAATDRPGPENKDINGHQKICLTEGSGKIEETTCFFGPDKALFGVLSAPASDGPKPDTCVILSNSGSVHHVGPNAVYTLMARALAVLGYYVFRIDLENIGDSRVLDPDVENHPYQSRSSENIHSAISFIKEQTGTQKFIVSGICSGAHTAFHVGLDQLDAEVSELLMINPLTFYWNPGMSLKIPSSLQTFSDQAYYKQSLRSMEKWKKLFTGQADFANIFRFVWRRGLAWMSQVWRDIHSMIFGERTPLAIDLQAIRQRGTAVNFIFSSTDPGLEILKSEAKQTLKKGIKERWIDIHIIDDADHTFSRKAARDNLLTVLNRHFTRVEK